MAINGVLVRKLEQLDSTLAELRAIGSVSVERLKQDRLMYRAVERLLQILVETIIDVCQRLIALKGETPGTSSSVAIERCMALGIIRRNEVYRKMVGFRNILVHNYADVDLKIVSDVVNSGLGSFGEFRDDVLRFMQT